MKPDFGRTNSFDLPLSLNKKGSAGDPNVVAYDPTNATASPAGAALIAALRVENRKALDKNAASVGKFMAEQLRPMVKRIAELERVLGIKQGQTTAALDGALVEYEDDGPSLDKLEAMAERQKEQRNV